MDSKRELLDENVVDSDMLRQIDTVLVGIKDVKNYHQLRARKMGFYILIDVHINVDSMLSVSAGYQVLYRARNVSDFKKKNKQTKTKKSFRIERRLRAVGVTYGFLSFLRFLCFLTLWR